MKSKIVTFEKSALKEICKSLGVPYDKDIIAFTKKGLFKKGLFSIIELSEMLNAKIDKKGDK
jgi:hypothetical protein